MGTVRRQLLLNTLKLYDLAMMILSFGLAVIASQQGRSISSIAEFLTMRVKIGNFVIFCGLLVVWHLAFSVFGIYASRRLARQWDEVADLIKATAVCAATIALASLLFRITMVSRLFPVYFWIAAAATTAISRTVLRQVLKRIRLHGRNLRDILIVGTNSRAIEFAKKIASTPELGYRVIGFVDEDWPGLKEFQEQGYPLVCSVDGLKAFLRDNVVDEVAVALPLRSQHTQASQVAAVCEEQGIMLRFQSNLFDLKLARLRTEEFGDEHSLAHYTGGMHEGWPVLVKRGIDFAVSLLAIVVLTPVFLLTALAIKLTCKGSILFAQNRLGLNKRRFKIFKFRTMVPDAERRMKEVEHMNEVSGPVFKIKNDPRITPIGKFLRKTSIDELPQLFNVLKGDMSLVGPRPLPVRDYEGFNEDWQRRRFSVRPGITCLWQVGGRSSVSFEQWMELDLNYIDEWSLWLDFQILLRTIPAVLRGSGAA